MRQEFTQEMKNSYHRNMQDVHTVVPGKVLSFDPDKCEAKIKPTAKYKKPDGSTIDFPDIFHVPVYFPQSMGQTATIVYPVRPGDECYLMFSEQALDLWRTGAESDTDLRFDLTNAIAVVGLFSKVNPLVKRAHDNESIIIQRENTYVELFDKKARVYTDGDIEAEADGNIKVTAGGNLTVTAGGNIDMTAGGNMRLTAARIDLN